MTIGENIRRSRRKRSITQEQLAQLIYITPQAVSRWKNGMTSPDAESLVALARIFGCSADEILGLSTNSRQERIRYFYETARLFPKPSDEQMRIVQRIEALDAMYDYPRNPGDYAAHNTPPAYRRELMREMRHARYDFIRSRTEFSEIGRMLTV